MKKTLACIVLCASLTALARTADEYFQDGINFLGGTNLVDANGSFSNAVALAPSNPTNHFFYALTQVGILPDQPATGAFLSRLGFPEDGRNPYNWTAIPTVSNGHVVLPFGVNADEFTAQLHTNILITLSNAEHNLAMIVAPRFSVDLNTYETHLGEVKVDFGDVLLMRAMLQGAIFSIYSANSCNLDGQLTDISAILTQESWAALLSTYTNALTIASTNDLGAAQSAFTNAIQLYLAASQFIRVDRPLGAVRLFNLGTNQILGELEFRETLTNLLASLTGPKVTVTADPTYTVSAAAFFSATNRGPRAALPELDGNEFVWDSFKDLTFGGIMTGITQRDMDRTALKWVTAKLDLPRVNLSAFYSFTNQGPNNAVVPGADGNFYGFVTYGNWNPYYGGGFGWVYEVTPSGGFKLIYPFGQVPSGYGAALDGGYPTALVAGKDGALYGTTQGSGTVYYSGVNQVQLTGTIFKLTTNGVLTTLHSFFYTNNVSTNRSYVVSPVWQGADGSIYGSTVEEGYINSYYSYYYTVFKITPAGTFSTVYILGSYPLNGLNVSADGTIYATSRYGGSNNAGAILKILPAGQANILHSLNYGSDGAYPSSLIFGSDGNMYGTTQYGGDNWVGTVFRCSTNGAFTTLASFHYGLTNAYYPLGSLAQGANGRLYGVGIGGANGKGAVFEVTTNGVLQTIEWFNQDTGGDSATGLTRGADGAFYGATSDGGRNGGGTFFRLFADLLQVSPTADFHASGPPAGPFNPTSTTFALTNVGTSSLTWAAGPDVPWLNVSPTAGTLASGAGATVNVNLNSTATNFDLGFYAGNVWFTNLSSGSLQGRAFSVNTGNGSFENGGFAGWTLAGDTSYTFVGNDLYCADYVHMGDSAALLGTSGGVGTLSLTVPTVPAKMYQISFWLDNPVGGIPSFFRVMWGAQMLFSASNLSPFGWTNLTFTVPAFASSTLLQFSFEQDYDYFGLDGVQVTQSDATAAGIIVVQNARVSGQTFQFSWNTTPQGTYQAQYKNRLGEASWLNLGAPVVAQGSSLSVTDQISTNLTRLYRVVRTN